MAEIDLALEHHELIKVKVPSIDREEKIAMMDAIVREGKAQKVQVIGHILVHLPAGKREKITTATRLTVLLSLLPCRFK